MKSLFNLRILLVLTLLGVMIPNDLLARKRQRPAEPRNLIYMIGDGMGLAHLSMLSIEGGYEKTAFDRMENIALITTRSANNRVTDSAAAGTALATGHKTNNGTLGLTPDGQPVESILARALRKGFGGGVVVTAEIQHATPASFYAHVPFRGAYDQISAQLVESGLDVAFGGGRQGMEAPDSSGITPLERLRRAGYTIVSTLEEVEKISSGRVMGFFSEGHLPSKMAGRDDFLPRATEAALTILEQNDVGKRHGFVLMVEGSQIDFESHGNQTVGLLAELRDFEAAVSVAMHYVDSHPDTLLVVTADHETGGLSLPSGNSDFTTSESGIEYRYGTGSHTATQVPVFLYGAGAECVNGMMENSDLAQQLIRLLDL